MKFPDRPNGATGALVRANEFDQSPTAPFSKTRQGSQVIHKRNGDLLIRQYEFIQAFLGTEPDFIYQR